MEKIASFQKDHDKLMPGFYLSGTANGVSTFDLRFKKPNQGDFIAQPALHSIEHIMATVLRNGVHKNDIVYFGPMGCRTGFYLLTVRMTYEEVLALLKESIPVALALDEIPGSRREECGNYLEHDLDGAREELRAYLAVLEKL